MPSSLERALGRQPLIARLALALLVLLAWAWLLAGAGTGMESYGSLWLTPERPAAPASMDAAMSMGGSDGGRAAFSALRFATVFLMWWIMMVAMMLPSASPTILLYARGARQAGLRPAAASFLAGYLAVWAVFSAVAALLQAMLQTSGLLSPLMASQNRCLSGLVLIAAGLYQFTPIKDLCLRRCRNPAWFLSRNYRPGEFGALRMGALHGAYCVGCCWPLMMLLFVCGVMNLLWIAVLTLIVAAEKLLPFGRGIATAGGLACLAGGAMLLAGY